eukprot:TRINITY_DN69767_c0_g1_i1.p1 TRINITY_DN69767_c0_g1~~TRINITY_DN69767_c0_g1_i1.p1  ORF type:complete len:479 (+),score=43.71 TRINITY_DN69767_c0_g1_i1:27-1439(+)
MESEPMEAKYHAISNCCVSARVLLVKEASTITLSVIVISGLACGRASSTISWATCAAGVATLCAARLSWNLWLACAPTSSFVVGPMPAAGEPAEGCRVLTDEQLEFFRRCGFLVLPQVVPATEARNFAKTVILPGLAKRGVDPEVPSTWTKGEKWHIILPAWCRGGRNTANNNRLGAMISGAIPDEFQHYPPLFASPQLLGALDDLHGRDDDEVKLRGAGATADACKADTSAIVGNGDGGRRWQWKGTLGWVHVRYPLPRRHPLWLPAGVAERLWRPPVFGWHCDGTYHPHGLGSTNQSAVVLPVFNDVVTGGGGTAVIAGSHRVIGKLLHSPGVMGCSYMAVFLKSHWLYNAVCALGFGRRRLAVVETAPCRSGDVLVMHPFLIHSASPNYANDIRLAFNLGTRWCCRHEEELGDNTPSGIEDVAAVSERRRLFRRDGLLDVSALVRDHTAGAKLPPLPRSLAEAAIGL